MPLTAKGKKLQKKFKEQYGKKKGEKIFYAMENSGKLKKVIKARGGDAARSDAASGRSAGRSAPSGGGGGGRDPSKQFEDKASISQVSRDAMTAQRQTARARISPSTTMAGQAAAYGAQLAFGVPKFITRRAIDYSPLAFGVPGGKKKPTSPMEREDGDNQKIIKPIVAEITKPVDQELLQPKFDPNKFFAFKAYKVGGLSGGVRSGPPPKRGPNSQVPPVKMKKGGYKK